MSVQAADASVQLTANETRMVLAFCGLCVAVLLRIAWARAKANDEVRDRVRAIDITLHGDEKAREPNGLVRKLNHVGTRLDTLASHFEKHVTEEAAAVIEGNRLRTDWNNKLHTRLNDIEDRLPKKRKPRSA